jgi:hypothetical protein
MVEICRALTSASQRIRSLVSKSLLTFSDMLIWYFPFCIPTGTCYWKRDIYACLDVLLVTSAEDGVSTDGIYGGKYWKSPRGSSNGGFRISRGDQVPLGVKGTQLQRKMKT